MFFRKKKPFYEQKKWAIAFSLVAILIAIRIILPTVIKIGLNIYLDHFSPTLKAHVSNVDLAILRGTYTVKGVTAEIKKPEKVFLEVEQVEASVPWSHLFKGELLVDLMINGADFTYSRELMPAMDEHLKKVKKDKKDKKDEDKTSLVNLARFDLKNSIIRTDLFPSLTKEQGILVTKIDVRATNLTPTEQAPRTPFSLEALVLKSGVVKTEGEAIMLGEKPQWTVDSEMKNFDLTSLNIFLKKKVPLTFTRGKLDLYVEAATQGGVIKGYIKPFIKGLDVIKSKEKFLGAKHWLIEIISALGNVVMKADQTMATRVPFVFDKEFKSESGEITSKAFEHGFLQELSRGIEHSVGLDKKEFKQSQEEGKK